MRDGTIYVPNGSKKLYNRAKASGMIAGLYHLPALPAEVNLFCCRRRHQRPREETGFVLSTKGGRNHRGQRIQQGTNGSQQ